MSDDDKIGGQSGAPDDSNPAGSPPIGDTQPVGDDTGIPGPAPEPTPSGDMGNGGDQPVEVPPPPPVAGSEDGGTSGTDEGSAPAA